MKACMKAQPICHTLLMVQRNHGKDYSYPSQKTTLGLLERFKSLKISKATLCRWLRVLEDEKYLIRRRRIRMDPKLGMIFKSTLYKITIKGYRLLARFGVDVSKEIAAYQRWLEEINPDLKDKRLKKEKAAAKYNPKVPEVVKKFLNGLGKVVSFMA